MPGVTARLPTMVKCTTTSVGSWKAYMLSITVLLSMLQLSNQVQIQISTPSTCGVAICFAIDDSGSIGSTPFQSARTFVKEVITQVSAISPGEMVAQYHCRGMRAQHTAGQSPKVVHGPWCTASLTEPSTVPYGHQHAFVHSNGV